MKMYALLHDFVSDFFLPSFCFFLLFFLLFLIVFICLFLLLIKKKNGVVIVFGLFVCVCGGGG